MTDYRALLCDAGMSAPAADDKRKIFESLHHAAKQLSFREPLKACYVPGRIEVLGKHTDYAGGRSLVCCAERGFCLLAGCRADRTIRFVDLRRNSTAEWELSPTYSPPPVHWAMYPATVTSRVARNFPSAHNGVDAVFSSDLPSAAGISSSSALIIASFFALAAANSLYETREFRENLPTREDLAAYLACVENGSTFRDFAGDTGVGTFGGSEDHTAILCAEAGRISQYRFCPLEFERSVKVPDDLTFAIAASGVAAEKTGKAREAYNRLSLATRSLLELWNRTSGRTDQSLGAAISSSRDAHEQLRESLAVFPIPNFPLEALQKRLEQFVEESQVIVPEAGNALGQHDCSTFGKLVDRSQSNAECLLANQIPETMFLARAARDLGAVAASAFGAGFGGSVWALVSKGIGRQFAESWASSYRDRFPQHSSSSFFLTDAGPPAQWL